jgi:hypothetical protein
MGYPVVQPGDGVRALAVMRRIARSFARSTTGLTGLIM